MDMRYRLLLQQEADGLLLPEQAVVAEAAKFSNWYESASQFLYRPCGKTGAKELDKYILSPTTLTGISEVGTAPAEAGIEDIPIGSIEFVETFLSSRYGIDHLTPIFIPPQIQPKRKTSIVTGSAGVQAFMRQNGLDMVFVKSAARVKGDTCSIIQMEDIALLGLKSNEPYFVSEPVDIVSEWRIFVKRGRVVGVRNYGGDEWVVPDRTTVLSMVNAYHVVSPFSYTLDVAAIQNSNGTVYTDIVEVHNFISCGLYGFDTANDLLTMLIDGIHWEIRQHKHYK